jgi:hypothetical protein
MKKIKTGIGSAIIGIAALGAALMVHYQAVQVISLNNQLALAAPNLVKTAVPTPTPVPLNGTTNGPDTTPRIAYWTGKVNQHVLSTGLWVTDPDGKSGSNIDKLTYCKKWYPNTVSVEAYKNETITTWRNSGNTGEFTATVMSYRCVPLDPTPRIAYWTGKVNQHVSASGVWTTDPDGKSGSNIDKLTYCKKWYPNTTSVKEYKSESITGWKDAGNKNNYTATVLSYQCMQPAQICPPNAKPSATIISPNGGEVYKDQQTITIKWQTCNLPATAPIALTLQSDNNKSFGFGLRSTTTNSNVFENTGSGTAVLPPIASYSARGWTFGKSYRIVIQDYDNRDIYDNSDATFTINK